jgi:DNA-binding winged helix-turn-helix (wHTH) protein
MRYTFGAYLLDTACYELYHAGTRVPLRPKALEVLAYLVVHHDRVVPKQELLAQLWPDQVVGEDGLKVYIMAVRQALGERGSAPRLLQTVRGRGYRVVAPVRVLDAVPGVAPPPGDVPPAVAAARGAFLPLCGPVAAPAGVSLPQPTEEYKLATVLCGALPDAAALAGRLGAEGLYRVTQTLGGLAQ